MIKSFISNFQLIFYLIKGRAYLKEWTLILYGTSENPDRRKVKFKPAETKTKVKSEIPSPTVKSKSTESSVLFTNDPIATKYPFNVLNNDIETHQEIPLSDSKNMNDRGTFLNSNFEYLIKSILNI